MAVVLQHFGCHPVLINSVEDHVHILFELARTVAVSQAVEEVKTTSSKWMKTQGAEFAGFAWQAGYGAFSVSKSNVQAVKDRPVNTLGKAHGPPAPARFLLRYHEFCPGAPIRRIQLDPDELAVRIVEAITRRSEEDSGMTLDQVQRLLATRVRLEAERAGIAPRELMRRVYRIWEEAGRPPMLGEHEVDRVLDSLAAKGLIAIEPQPAGPPAIRWRGIAPAELERRWPELTHEEQTFVRGILRAIRLYTKREPA